MQWKRTDRMNSNNYVGVAKTMVPVNMPPNL